MIIRILVKMSLEDNEGNVIKEEDSGRAYLTDIDLIEAAKEWWEIQAYNNTFARMPKYKKKRFTKEAVEAYKIVDILTNALKRTLFGRFLCDKDDILEKNQKEFDKEYNA